MKSFRWSGWIKPDNQPLPEDVAIYGGNFALDKNGKPITRTDEEMENCDD